jgi:hypothetical protein
MAFKRLFSEEMLQLSATWVDTKSKAHKAILATADLAPSLPRIIEAHGTLAHLAQPAQVDPALAVIIEKETEIDLHHDEIIRGTWGLLTSSATLLGVESGGAELLQLRDIVFPDGLQSAQKSYRAEAGQAVQLSKRLTPAHRAQLAAIVVGPKGSKVTLQQLVDELIHLAKDLGALEDDKARLQPAPSEQGPSVGAALLTARNQWVRVANALVANGDLAQLDAETEKLIFGPLRAAEKTADRRPTKGRAAKAPAEPSQGEPEPAAEVPAVAGGVSPGKK